MNKDKGMGMRCSSCNEEIPADTPPSENWEYYCPKCGMEKVLREIRKSKVYYKFQGGKNEDKVVQ